MVRHTVIAAAHGILSDIAIKKGIKTIIANNERIRKDKKKDYIKIVHEAQNFFKHADFEGDESKILEFIPDLTEFHLYDACLIYQEITQERPMLHFLFMAWFSVKHPKLFESERISKVAACLPFENKMAYLELLPELERQNEN
ncbi:MAG: hypothetical protein Q7T51_03610 [Candidatus Moranbacteria bacterium]|nr:hypothetical protein [Candidatus Moranbacteria bacterium]